MTLKDKLWYLLILCLEYGINPRKFMWRYVMGGHSGAYYDYLAELRSRRPFDQNKLEAVHQDFKEIFKNARQIWNSRWRGEWYLVIFDIPEKERRFRDQLRRKLTQFGFGQLQKSILICPVDRWKLVQKSVFYEQMKPYLVYLKIEKVYGFNEDELIEKCWDLTIIKKQYEKFMTQYGERVQKFLNASESWDEKERKAASKWLLILIEEELSKLMAQYPPLPRRFASKHIPFQELMKHYQKWHRRLT